MVQSISTPARHAHSCAKPHRSCPSHCSAIVSCLSCAKPHQACPSHCNAIRSCSIARETASSMPIAPQHHQIMLNRMRKVVVHAHLAATSSCDAQWGTESCPGRIGPLNTRMQLTAFGARDRRYFKAILCRVPSAATDAQHVGPCPIKPVLHERPSVCYTTAHDRSAIKVDQQCSSIVLSA